MDRKDNLIKKMQKQKLSELIKIEKYLTTKMRDILNKSSVSDKELESSKNIKEVVTIISDHILDRLLSGEDADV